MYSEDDLLMLSALQHLLFCPRQCALIHTEQLWLENRLTAKGRILHERVHTSAKESRRRLRLEFDLPIRSLELGLIGRADVVEFHLCDDGVWQPYPVEYKRGRPKKDDSKRLRRVAKACRDFGQRVQFSVFECIVDPAQWIKLRQRLINEIDEEVDSLRFYFLGSNWKHRVEHIGAKETIDQEGPLII